MSLIVNYYHHPLQGKKGMHDGIAKDNRLFLNAVFWILRTGAPWHDLPPDYSDWKNTHRSFCRWRDKGIWKDLLSQIIDEPDFEWMMIDGGHIKVHPHAAGAVEDNQDMSRTKGGLTPSPLGRGGAWYADQIHSYGLIARRLAH